MRKKKQPRQGKRALANDEGKDEDWRGARGGTRVLPKKAEQPRLRARIHDKDSRQERTEKLAANLIPLVEPC